MTDQESSVRVSGVVDVPPGMVPKEAPIVTVRVEDTSRSDAPSKIVGEQRMDRVPLDPAGTRLPFAVDVPAGLIERRGRYTVRVHIDVSGSGEVSEGDFVSTQSYPVLTTDDEGLVTVRVKAV